ncbi:hypothetical protein NLU13_8578 [Sarocladium strictum]|uniref:C2H2-type domain-containing protein n=1 Tax=Sarocladium strictum TaxID=5046 RepID=A0AA39GEC0_SARSR|nr:hypothetical protein NLU13_8578 [Sarocladium strictum]
MSLYGRPAELPPPASWYDESGSPCWPTTYSLDFNSSQSVEHPVLGPEEHPAVIFPFPPLDDNAHATKQPNIIFDVPCEDTWSSSPVEFINRRFVPRYLGKSPRRRKCPSSTVSASTSISSGGASTWSSVQTDDDYQTIVPASSSSRVPSPSAPFPSPCSEAFTSDVELEAHIRAAHTHTCKWVGCGHPSFASRDGLVWHVESTHLLVCPCRGCDEADFGDARLLQNHIAVGHPEVGKNGIIEWQLSKQVTGENTGPSRRLGEAVVSPTGDVLHFSAPVKGEKAPEPRAEDHEHLLIATAKRKAQQQLQRVIDKRAKKASVQPQPSVQPSEERISAVRRKLMCRLCIEQRSFSNFDALKRHHRVTHPEWPAPNSGSLRYTAVSSPSGSVMTPTSVGNTSSPLSPLRESVSSVTPSSTEKAVPFPLVFEHAVLPFLITFLPRWTGPRHVVSVTRGRTPQARRISIMTPTPISRARKILIAKHLHDLLSLPEIQHHRANISFLFPVGTVDRTFGTSCWARGLSREHMDDICVPRNPFYFSNLCMGDSIGISGTEEFEETTATLGPCISVGGGSYWLANFHPFIDAYRSANAIPVEHPSAQDRAICVSECHDAVAGKTSFHIGDVQVTSGLTLKTTRVTHDPYWEENCTDQPLVVTDWALIDSQSSHANILRRFPIDYPNRAAAPEPEALVRSTSAVIPGGSVVSSGRTSGYGSGQVCEIPAYVSGAENGTGKATREWFIEEAYPCDNEDEWIRGGIGVHGDSGAAVIDAESRALVGQLWGRNKYWGPGPRHTFFTPIADIFDDIQEKCGQQTRPQLPQHRNEGDCYPVEPPCRTCYDTYRNLDSRRSSRMSIQSMVMAAGEDGDGAYSIEAASELATPRPVTDRNANVGLEEIGMTFGAVLWAAPTPSRVSQGVASPGFNDMRSPYAQTLELDDLQERDHGSSDPLRKRAAYSAFGASPNAASQSSKRQRLVE